MDTILPIEYVKEADDFKEFEQKLTEQERKELYGLLRGIALGYSLAQEKPEKKSA